MTCINCGHAMTTKRENVPYTALPGAVMIGVPMSRCANCGESEVAIPAIDELNRALTDAVIRKRGRLAGVEGRFLRSYLGYSGTDFARLIGAWESVSDGQLAAYRGALPPEWTPTAEVAHTADAAVQFLRDLRNNLLPAMQEITRTLA